MSDLFPDDPAAVQSRREAVQRNFEAGPEPMDFWSASYDVLINGPRRGLYAVDEGLSRFGSVLANIPNTAFETPSYFRQTEAAHRITDPSSYEKTALSRWFDEQAEVDRRAIRRLTPDPRRVSEAQRTLSGLTQMITMGFIGAPLGPAGPALTLGAGFGAESYHEQLDAGVDEDTATQIGIQQAAFGAAMGALPAAVPIRGGRFALWPALARAGSGATINVGVGMAMRQSLGDHLRRAGYGEQAERYRALDGQALVMDAVLGAVFGAFLSHADGTDKSASSRSAPPDTARSAVPPREPREPDWYYEEARQLATDEDLEAAYAHGLIARELGHPEAQGLLDLIAEEGGESVVQDGQALASIIGVRDGLIEPTQEHIDAALTLQADRQARVDSAPGVPLNLEAEARHGESLARAERQIADGEEVDVAGLWADQDGSDYAPHPVDYESEAVLEEAVRQVLEEDGYAHLARDVEAARARIRAMGGEIGPDEALFSFGARPRGVGPERGSEAFHDERLSTPENKAVEMARNNYSNAEIADELDFNSVNQVSVVLAHAAKKLGGVVWGRSRSGAPGQYRGEATATIEEIIALRNYLRTRGYRNYKGPAPLGTRSINQIIAERLHISPKSVAVRISKYERDVREGRREPLFSQGARPIFESAVERVVAESRTARASGAQWWATISKATGVKREELEWIGLEDWLKAQDGAVSREDVLEFVRANGVRVEETVLGGGEAPSAALQRELLPLVEEQDRLFQELSDLSNQIVEGGPGYEAAIERRRVVDDRAREIGPTIIDLRRRISDMAGEKDTKWDSYTLPGGSNYRELLLRLPVRDEAPSTREAAQAYLDAEGLSLEEAAAEAGILDPEGNELLETARALWRERNPAEYASRFRSSHFDQPNILAHVRFNERTDSSGRRTLFIEEIQSDWGQTLRKDKERLHSAIDENFDVIVERMKQEGVLREVCD